MKLGIDVGSFAIRVVKLDDENRIVFKRNIPHKNKVRQILLDLLKEIDDAHLTVGICGNMMHLTGLDECSKNELVCLCKAQELLHSDVRSIIHLGAQKTYYAILSEHKKPQIYKNTNCSSGTGSFFEEQAGRLGIQLSDISSIVQRATTVPHIAGRCSVFSKTDIIHKMQEGVSPADLLNGLCHALIRNYKSSVLKNQEVQKPVLFSGGVMKNSGVVNAACDLLSLSPEDYILDDNSDYYCAIGAGLLANTELSVDEIKKSISSVETVKLSSSLAPLYLFAKDSDKIEYTPVGFTKGDAYLGIDVGSTSINLVLIDSEKRVEYYSYVKNIGRPLDIVKQEIKKLNDILPSDTVIRSIATTGSGREYIAEQIGADLTINEITAQTSGAVIGKPDIDTIFEIGGQDSKYMSVDNGNITNFEMNKVCAAGTGAFLEEQISKLGISMSEFLDYALKSESPCELGNRCTVFIESSITKALSEGRSMEDVCAGLAYAIASNYLERVVNQKPVGDAIAIQGGIAYNQAVVCAFRSLTKKDASISPYFSVTGALGAAALCLNKNYLVFDKDKNQAMNEALSRDTEKSYLGSYSYEVGKKSGKKRVGIPRVLFLHKMFPLFQTIFTKLGYETVLSPLTTDEIITLAQQYTIEETCYPIKLVHGHIAWLLNQDVDYIILPRLYTIKHEGSVARKDYSCMYMQTSPLIMEEIFHFEKRGVTLIAPELSLDFGMRFMVNSILGIADILGISRPALMPHAIAGVKAVMDHTKRLESLGDRHIDAGEPTFVLMTRVYNLADPALNMGIEDHLNKMGCRVVHLEHLHASYMNVSRDYNDLYWPFGQHILTGLNIIRENPNFYPIYITNHGCGPDTAIQHYLKTELSGRAYLHLEVDEHTSKIGIITRLEAFLYSLKPQQITKRFVSEMIEPKISLIADFGEYSNLIAEKSALPIQKVQKAETHKLLNYAINKEYYSLLVMLEEILSSAEPSAAYELPFPIDEGSEVFGQYGHLIVQELQRQGRNIILKPFYIEDIIERPDADDIFKSILDIDMNMLVAVDERPVIAIGEPLCIYKDSIFDANTKFIRVKHRVVKMPLSEALLFHITDTDRKGKHKKKLSSWRAMHMNAVKKYGRFGVFTDIDQLFQSVKGKLDFMVGDFSKYRFAKLLCLNKTQVRGALLLNSAEENSAVILKLLCEAHANEITVPTMNVDIDYTHSMAKEDADMFLEYI